VSPPDYVVSRALCPDLFTNPQESRSFFFFREHTIPQISGSFDADFWHRFILQTSYHDPAVRHASCALGALHECFEFGSMSLTKSTMNNDNTEFALQQYSKAIGCLLAPMKKNEGQAADVALMTCILFICFEVCLHELYEELIYLVS
jgi:hypothetical protein